LGLTRRFVYTAAVLRLTRLGLRPLSFAFLGAFLGAALHTTAGCAGGSVPGQQDAAVREDATATHDDAAPQVDAPVQDDAAPAQDAPRDTTVAQQDAPHDTTPPPQQDAQQDTLPAGYCTDDSQCNTAGGQYCYIAGHFCFVPGECSSSAECVPGSNCALNFAAGQMVCSCAPLQIPPLGCRDHETCNLNPVVGSYCGP
jgi:hypothetical protein